MSLQIHFPAVGCGDCLIVIKERADGTKNALMVDCATFNKEVENLVVDELNKKIDCLIITHFDSDHIKGIIAMLKKYPELIIGKILYNGRPSLEIDNTTNEDKNKGRMDKALGLLYGYEPLHLEGNISAKQAVSLSTLFMENEHWRNVWHLENISVEDSPEIDLGDMGKLYVISPTNAKLKYLADKYKSEFAKLFRTKVDTDIPSLYEVLLRLSEARKKFDGLVRKEERISAHVVSESYLKHLADSDPQLDNSPFNAASIAFIWEVDDHRFLFEGDALPNVMEEGLKKFREQKRIVEDDNIVFDIIKVSHHGSESNTSRDLLSKIDSSNFIFCGSNMGKAPSLMAIAKIICRRLSEEIDAECGRSLYFNLNHYSNTELEEFLKIQQRLGIGLPKFKASKSKNLLTIL